MCGQRCLQAFLWFYSNTRNFIDLETCKYYFLVLELWEGARPWPMTLDGNSHLKTRRKAIQIYVLVLRCLYRQVKSYFSHNWFISNGLFSHNLIISLTLLFHFLENKIWSGSGPL